VQTQPTLEDQVATLTNLVQQLAQSQHDAVNASAPAAEAATPAPVEVPAHSEVAPPAVASLVHRVMTVPGDEAATTIYGQVVAVDAETNTATVAWFVNTSDVRGDELTKVE
jgi:hypothetical protein